MDTVTENSNGQSITASVDANGKRKSISVVDEKLISQALNSTSITEGEKPYVKPSKHKQRDGQEQWERKDHSHQGVRSAPTKNGSHQQGWGKRESNHSAPHRAKAKGAKSQANPVVIYYNDPKVEIDVKELLTKCHSAKPASQTAHEGSKRRNGHHKPQSNGTANGIRHTSKPFPPYNQQEINGNWREKANSLSSKSQMTNNHKSEPVTIYYGANNAAIKDSVKSLQEPAKLLNGNDNSTLESDLTKSSPSSNVIESSEMSTKSAEENGIERKSTSDANGVALGDEYDVINGGDPIENPELPTEGTNHAVRCTMVSHPGHFYVKFIDERHDQQLSQMSGFYNNDEPIDLSLDVLKPGQYFAAKATSKEPGQEWIRVQLLHLESADLINCLLVDEGCFGMFKLSQLQPLYNQFRTVPKRAIRASLAGVKSKDADWLPNQTLEFKSLVENRRLRTGEQQFPTWNEKSPIEIELYFDDENEELKDKSVAQVLIERGIAVEK